jgi:ribosomal protein L16 Arg81 hydroxylase
MSTAFASRGTDAGQSPANQSSQEAKPAAAFRDAISLQSLVAPTSEEEFRSRYWERKPLILQRGNPGYYGDLFTLQDFDSSVTRGPSYVKTAEATTKKNAKHQGGTANALEGVLNDMRGGHTLILDGMQNFDPKLTELCRTLSQETGHKFQTNIYLTPPSGKGFTPHWDNHDVFVLQVLGSKHWKVEKERRAFPQRDGIIEDEGREFRGEVHEFTLRQGDMVYIPRGFVHAAECGAESSMHITLGVYPTTWSDFLGAVMQWAVVREEGLRHALPFGYMKGGDEGMVKRMAHELRELTDPAFLGQVLERFREECVKKAALDISGQVEAFFDSKPLGLDDRFGVRPALFYTLRRGDDTVTLNVGTRTITFPGFFAEALEFALTRPLYTIRELPGDLDDEEKIIFLERLMQEAVIVRK